MSNCRIVLTQSRPHSTDTDYVRPSTYKPTFVSSTSKPFSVFIGSSQQPPRTVRPKQKEEEEVFYIFYENDDKPLVRN